MFCQSNLRKSSRRIFAKFWLSNAEHADSSPALVSFLLSEGQFRVPEVLKTHKFDVKPFNKFSFDLKKVKIKNLSLYFIH